MYRHCDGYPESVLPALEPIISEIKQFDTRKGDVFAAYVAEKIESIEETYFIMGNRFQKTYKPFQYTTDIHGDIEWLYTLNVHTGELEYEKVA
tara:strand:- start:4276 stop:4554 length:279 start_codon:yes stop_codon:yes gene_type:complete